MKLLTKEILKKLPPLHAQEGKGGEAVAYVKLFTPGGSFTWFITEGAPEGDDFLFFGLVDGHEKELGYFSLSELRSVRGPMGLAVERDKFWTPRALAEIAPEMFPPRQVPSDPAPTNPNPESEAGDAHAREMSAM